TDTTAAAPPIRGGEWLLHGARPEDVFTPEQITDEHRLIAQTAQEFVDNEVLPKLGRLEEKDWNLARDLLKRAGALGLLGVDARHASAGRQLRADRREDVDHQRRLRRSLRRLCESGW